MRSANWKLRREIRRVAEHLVSIPAPLLGQLARWRHDQHFILADNAIKGRVALRDNFAVVVLYQPTGVRCSFLAMLDHLIASDLSPFVVVNHGLPQEARQKLLVRAALVLERPNSGYDFGGYRDGIRTLQSMGVVPKNLILLNDSSWFPIRRGCTLLTDALSASEDIFGIYLNTKSRRFSHHHLQSYFYRFGSRVLADSRFWDLWQSMPLHNDKRLVVRTAEIKLTGRLAAMGYTVGARFRPEDIVAATRELTDAQIVDIARFHAATTDRGRSIFEPVLAGPAQGLTSRLRARMADSRFRYYFIDAHPAIFLGVLNSPFIKKSREPHFVAQRDAIRAGGYLEGLLPEVRAEIETWDDPRPPT